MPRKPKEVTNGKRMISWRERDCVYREACAMAEMKGLNDQVAFSRFFRAGMVADRLCDEIGTALRARAIAQATTMPEKTAARIYEPDQGELMRFVTRAVYEKLERDGMRAQATELIG